MEPITFPYSRTKSRRTTCRVELRTKRNETAVYLVLDTPESDSPYYVAAFTSSEVDDLIDALTQAQRYLQSQG